MGRQFKLANISKEARQEGSKSQVADIEQETRNRSPFLNDLVCPSLTRLSPTQMRCECRRRGRDIQSSSHLFYFNTVDPSSPGVT